jgi:peptidyl-prolyl cis-trans isomerase C
MRVVGRVAGTATALVVAMGLGGCGRDGPQPGGTKSGGGALGAGVLAQVNDARLTEADLQQLIPNELRESITGAEIREILDRWVRTELLYQRARSEGLDDNAAVAARLHELQRDLLADELLQRELAQRVKVGNEELQEYYRAHQAEYTQELQLKHILVDTREEAEQIVVMVRNGAVFEELARARSRDASAPRGGDLGFLGKGAMNPAFDPHVFAAVPGAVVGPIATTFGFHVVKVAARRPAAEPLSFEAVRDEILHSLLLEKQQAAQQQIFEEMRRGAQVQVATSYAGLALEPAPKRVEEPRWTGRGGAFGNEEGATHPADTLGTAPE